VAAFAQNRRLVFFIFDWGLTCSIDFGFDLSSSVSLLHQVRFHILPIAFSPLVAAMLKKTE
jgi:hypothetical protein